MIDPANWPPEAMARVAGFVASGDAVGCARAVLHEAAKLGPATDVMLDRRGQVVVGELADTLAESAARFIWNVGAPADADPEALKVALDTIAARVRLALVEAQASVLDRLLVKSDGTATLGPAPAPASPEATRRERATRAVARVLERDCANLAPAERKLIQSLGDKLGEGGDIDPAEALALEDLLRKSHPIYPSICDADAVKAAYAKNGDDVTELLSEWRQAWDALDAMDQDWLRSRVGLRVAPDDQVIAWRLHADALYRRFSGEQSCVAAAALAAWRTWPNLDLLDEAETAWLAAHESAGPLGIDDALYVLELHDAKAAGE